MTTAMFWCSLSRYPIDNQDIAFESYVWFYTMKIEVQIVKYI